MKSWPNVKLGKVIMCPYLGLSTLILPNIPFCILYYMYFKQTFIIRCTASEILAEIDHKGPNWPFLTLKMNFRVIPYLSYFRTGLVSQQRSYMMQSIWAALRYYWIISIIKVKWAKPDPSDLKNDLLNKSISWQLINIIPRSCIQEIKKSYQTAFEKIGKM